MTETSLPLAEPRIASVYISAQKLGCLYVLCADAKIVLTNVGHFNSCHHITTYCYLPYSLPVRGIGANDDTALVGQPHHRAATVVIVFDSIEKPRNQNSS